MVAWRLKRIELTCSFPTDNSRRCHPDNRGTALAHRPIAEKDRIHACRDGMARNPSYFNGSLIKPGYRL
jgi:hypothetical protein